MRSGDPARAEFRIPPTGPTLSFGMSESCVLHPANVLDVVHVPQHVDFRLLNTPLIIEYRWHRLLLEEGFVECNMVNHASLMRSKNQVDLTFRVLYGIGVSIVEAFLSNYAF